MVLLLLYFLLSILTSFLCSVWEAVLLSIPPSYVEIKRKEGSRTGDLLAKFKKEIDRPLSAILTLNTIAHTVGAIGVGASASALFGSEPMAFSIMGWGVTKEFLIGAGMTLSILIFSEIIPKTIGANSWRKLAPVTVRSVNVIIYALWPLVWLSQVITKRLKKDKNRSVFSRADFSAMAEIGEKEGVFEQHESKIIRNLLRFHTIQTKDIMTPRTVVQSAAESTPIDVFYQKYPKLRFSRIPVYNANRDEVVGFILKDELLSAIIQGQGKEPLSSIKRDILIVSEKLAVPELFERLIEQREHIALVVDEFGGMAGLVTMEDAIETLLGLEIVDELDNIEDMQLLARKNWEKRAKSLGILPGEE